MTTQCAHCKQPGLMLLGLAVLMVATRYHHFGSAIQLADASLAVFFLAGFYLAGWLALPVLLALAGVVDYAAIHFGGVSDWCVTPAYWFLIPTYAAMWFGGRWYARKHAMHWRSLPVLAAALAVATTLAFVISNGSFYLFSGRYESLSLMQYAESTLQYFAPYLGMTALYVALAAVLHVIVTHFRAAPAAAKQ